jgi:hypothetical protein
MALVSCAEPGRGIGERWRRESLSRCGVGLAYRSARSCSGRVEGGALSRYAGSGRLDSGGTRDDVQGAAFAQRA